MNLTVKNSIGEQFTIIAIRYFKFNGGNYLIFTKNEVDESGYQKLYISKINNMVGNNIEDEIEWNLVRDTIKVIAKSNKENTTLPVEDLNEAEINGIQILGQKPFKLTLPSVSLLAANKKVQVNTGIVASAPIQPANNIAAPTVDNLSAPQAGRNKVPVNPSVNVTNQAPFTPVFPQAPVQSPETLVTPTAEVTPNFTESAFATANPSVAPVTNNAVLEPEPAFAPNVAVNNVEPLAINMATPNVSNVQSIEQPTINEPFDFGTPAVPTNPVETVDYKKLYEEQTLKLNALTVELDKYKSLIEQLKSIIK